MAENGISKKSIADYLEQKYGDNVVVNCRDNFISTGLPLADTHYAPNGIVRVAGKQLPNKVTKLLQGVCFVYVYELSQGKVLLLVKTNGQHSQELKEVGRNISRSKFPKFGEWYSIAVDNSFASSQEVFDILDRVKASAESAD